MKKTLVLIVLFLPALSLWAQNKPNRFVEVGFDAGFSFANNYLRTGDIFKETITLDLSKMAGDLKEGLSVFFDAHEATVLNFNLGATWGFGLFAGMDSLGHINIPQSMVELLTQGNELHKTYSDDFGLGAAVFLETGFWASARIRRIKFTVRPAYFIPLVYLDKSRAHYTFAAKADGTIAVIGNYDVDIFTPLPLDDLSIDAGSILGKGGADISLRAEYPLFRNLVIGGSLTHIPIFPAQLSDKYTMSGSFEFNSNIEDIINGDYEIPDFEPANESDTGNRVVFRPFKFGIDAVYRPFYIRLLTIKPTLALVFNNIYNMPIYADFGVTGELNLARILRVDAGTHYEDLVWKQRVGLALNFRIIEFGIGVTTQSQQFLKSFQGAGFGIDIGLRMGF
ncbi:hypothetical protein LQZ19_16620 [Treponema primitia]|uniref:hypothetical protein n=1 Tax=Treponema primitia TaxID=88058 RepID=UPI00397F0FCF